MVIGNHNYIIINYNNLCKNNIITYLHYSLDGLKESKQQLSHVLLNK